MLAQFIKSRSSRWALAAVAFVGVSIAAGCQDSAPAGKSASTMPIAKRGGAELWADNCLRCHNLRPPTQFSNNEWQIIMQHMRIRANLTGQEQRDILAFIQSANAH
jgi:hypothetical protein